ncbi:MAG: hypothetical protein ACTSUE_22665 [Promethearchaeota archaeon]
MREETSGTHLGEQFLFVRYQSEGLDNEQSDIVLKRESEATTLMRLHFFTKAVPHPRFGYTVLPGMEIIQSIRTFNSSSTWTFLQ